MTANTRIGFQSLGFVVLQFANRVDVDLVYEILMAVPTGLLSDTSVVIGNSQILFEVTCCERQRMEKAVPCLAVILRGNTIVRCVTIVAAREFPMR